MEFEFSKNTVVDDLATVPPDFHSFYQKVEPIEAGGKVTFKLNTESAPIKAAVAVIAGQNVALKKVRAEVGQKIDLTPLKDLGTTVEEIKAAHELKVQELNDQIKGTDVQKIKKDLEVPWTQKLTAAEKERDSLKQHLHDELVESRTISAIAEVGASLELLKPIIRGRIKTSVEGGKYVVRVVDEQGADRYNGTGAPMSIPELIAELRQDKRYAPAFPSEAKSGGGTSPSAAASSTAVNRQRVTQINNGRSSTDKIMSGIKNKQHLM